MPGFDHGFGFDMMIFRPFFIRTVNGLFEWSPGSKSDGNDLELDTFPPASSESPHTNSDLTAQDLRNTGADAILQIILSDHLFQSILEAFHLQPRRYSFD